MKIVLNKCYGGFSLSEEACEYLGCKSSYRYSAYEERSNPDLVRCVEELRARANGKFARLEVVEIPDGANYEIFEYDGIEIAVEVGHYW